MQSVTWRYIFFLLCSIGVFATAAIVWMLIWMSERIDQIEREKTQALIELKFEESLENVRISVEDYAYWTFAYELVRSGEADKIYENIGTGATDGALFDQLFILDTDGTLLHAFDENFGDAAHPLFESADFDAVWAELRKTDPEDYISTSSILEIGNQLAFVAAAWITPDDLTGLDTSKMQIIIGTVKIDDDLLTKLAARAQVDQIRLEAFTPVSEPAAGAIELFDTQNNSLGVVNWRSPSPGSEIRRELLPGVLIMAFGILGVCAVATRYFQRQHSALETANRIATTDQLTGLLNRAGLASYQQDPYVKHSLEMGHLAAIYIDLNNFKDLNDTHGHIAGDLALSVTADRLKSAVRRADLVARLGGDEFVCIINDPDPETAAISVANRILALTKAPISFEAHEQVVTPSVGLAISKPGMQWETVLSQSDAAMYWSKQKSSKTPVVYSKSMDAGMASAA